MNKEQITYEITLKMMDYLRKNINDAGVGEEDHVKMVLHVLFEMTTVAVAAAVPNMDKRRRLLDVFVEDTMEMDWGKNGSV